MKVFEIKKQVASKKEELRSLVNLLETRDLTPEESQAFDDLKSQVDSLKSRLEKMESVEVDEDPAEEAPPARSSKPIALESRKGPAVHTQKHEYSLMRAINRVLDCGRLDGGLEKEMSDEVAVRSGKKAQGFFMPHDVRALTLTTGTGSVGTHVDSSYIELLRNKSVVMSLGATVLSDMQGTGTFAIPRQSGGATAYWVADGVAITGSNQTLDQVTFTGKTVGAFTDITRKFFLQTSISAEQFVRDDLATTLALEIDRAAINGSGSGAEPTGIIGTSGIGSVAGGTNGLAPTFAHMVGLESEVAVDNADLGKLAYLTNAAARGKLKTTVKVSAYPEYIWESDQINGYNAVASNQVPSNLTKGSASGVCSAVIFGNWSDLVMAFWGSGVDVLVDPYTGSSAGTVRIVALQDMDLKLRHAPSFACMLDALTT